MKKEERVKDTLLFNEIIQKGTKISNKYFTIFSMSKTEEKPLFGISAPKRLGNAVMRNKLKRQTRELVYESKLLFKNHKNYIIIIKDACKMAKYSEKLAALKQLIGEIHEKTN